MSNIVLIRPKQGLKIRDPRDSRPLPADRTTRVELDYYWMRRLKCGDVYKCDDEPKQVVQVTQPQKEEKSEKKVYYKPVKKAEKKSE